MSSTIREIFTKQDIAINFIGKQIRPKFKNPVLNYNYPAIVKLAFNDAMTYNSDTGAGGTVFGYKFNSVKGKQYNKKHYNVIENLIYIKQQEMDPTLDVMSYSDYLQSFAIIAIRDALGPNLTSHHLIGRRDVEDEAELEDANEVPQPEDGATQFKDAFYIKGFDERELAALSFVYVYGDFMTRYQKTYTVYHNFEIEYYKYLASEPQPNMYPIDKILVGDSAIKEYVDLFASSKKEFHEAFEDAWVKLHTLGNDDKDLYLEVDTKPFDY